METAVVAREGLGAGSDGNGRSAPCNLLDLSVQELEAFVTDLGEKPFRATQLLNWIHRRGADTFAQMTDLGRKLRERLTQVAVIRPPRLVDEKVARDGTRKWLVEVAAQRRVEMVFIPEERRSTLCISSQVGCALGCSFCATGKQGWMANLATASITGQVWLAMRRLRELQPPRKLSNVVLMGMGEPLLNLDNVVRTLEVLRHDLAYGIPRRRLTLSTAGVIPAIHQLATRADVSLALSLHAPNDALRDQLVPLNRKYPIAPLLDACRRHLRLQAGSHPQLTVEYTLLAGVNDRPHHAHQLGRLLASLPCKINLIPFNPFPGSGYRRPGSQAVEKFRQVLIRSGVSSQITVRRTRGEDIQAACGQLAGAGWRQTPDSVLRWRRG